MRTYKSIYLLLCLFWFTSCEKHEVEPIDTYSTGYINFTLDTVKESYTNLPVKCYPYIQADEENLNMYTLIGNNIPALFLTREKNNQAVGQPFESVIHISFTDLDIDKITVPYTIKADVNRNLQYAQIQLGIKKDNIYNTYYGTTHEDILVTITQINKEEGRIQGSFSGSVIHAETEEIIKLKEGTFDVKFKQK